MECKFSANFGTCRNFLSVLYCNQGETMTQVQTMTLDEKLAISCKAAALDDAGDSEGYTRLMKTLPIPPYLAKVLKEKVGLDFLLNGGWNLAEVEAEFGSAWLVK